MRNFEYVEPASVADAATAAARPESMLKGAGTDLIDLMKAFVIGPQRLVSMLRVPNLGAITPMAGGGTGFTIGATVTLSAIAADERLPPVLRQAAGEAATPQIRNMATAAGCLCQRPRCWYFRDGDTPCLKKGGAMCFAQEGENKFHAIFENKPCAIVHPSNLATALAALDAEVVTHKRTIPIGDFFALPSATLGKENVLEVGEVITGINIKEAAPHSAYREAREKLSFDWALISAGVTLTMSGGKITAARVVLGSAAPVPWRAGAAEKLLVGQKPDARLAAKAGEAALAGATPLSQNGYKVTLGKVMVKRAILGAAGLPEIEV